MKTLYKGPINTCYAKKLEVSRNFNTTHEVAYKVAKSDALFYRGIAGKMISFEYDTNLPTMEEATAYVMTHMENYPNNDCIFAEDGDIKPFKDISNEEFSKMKKEYKELKKKKTR